MKFTPKSPLAMLCLVFTIITLSSCSKDSDLIADYVALDPDIGTIAKFVANDSYLISISDNQEDDTFEIVVNNENSVTSASGSNGTTVDDSYQVSSNVSITLDVLANDTFENKEGISIIETSQPNNGTVVINDDNTLTYTPDEILATEPVTDTFTYSVEVENNDGTVTSGEADVNLIIESNTSRVVSNISPYSYCQDGNPVGGGAGYTNRITSNNADIHITSFTTWSALKSTIENAPTNSIIFIDGSLSVNASSVTGNDIIAIPQGVTLASDRGINAGALFYMTGESNIYRGLFVTNGTGVRITGIRFEGASEGYDRQELIGNVDRSFAIVNRGFENFEVDNCEFSNFGFGGVIINYITGSTTYPYIGETVNNNIHHNYFHDNTEKWLGYGVSLNRGHVNVYSNIFENGGHDVMGQGGNHGSYEVYCNTHKGPNYKHNVDMHGDDGDGGENMWVHHNDFKDIMDDTGWPYGSRKFNINFRGTPVGSAIVEYNRFKLADAEEIVAQDFWAAETLGKLRKENNTYSGATPVNE